MEGQNLPSICPMNHQPLFVRLPHISSSISGRRVPSLPAPSLHSGCVLPQSTLRSIDRSGPLCCPRIGQRALGPSISMRRTFAARPCSACRKTELLLFRCINAMQSDTGVSDYDRISINNTRAACYIGQTRAHKPKETCHHKNFPKQQGSLSRNDYGADNTHRYPTPYTGSS